MAAMNRRSFVKPAGVSMAASFLGFPRKGRAQKPAGKKSFRKIGIEEHFSTPDHLNSLLSLFQKTCHEAEVVRQEEYLLTDAPFLPEMAANQSMSPRLTRLCDLGEGRLKEMDRCGMEVQVLSLVSPCVRVFDAAFATRLARECNDRLAAAAKDHPKRFAGFASLAPQDPKAAADELERAVKGLGMKGALINSHTKGEYLDDRKYWVIFERAANLNAPLYLHPRGPSPDPIKLFMAYPKLSGAM